MRKHMKVALIIMLALIAVLLLSGCSAYYKPTDSNWVFQVW